MACKLFDPDNPRQLPSRGLDEIVTDYVRLIREVHPHGPYILAGLCVAGIIAYEAAHQLREAGEPVALVVMADTWLPGYLKRLPLGRRILFRLRYELNALKFRFARIYRGELRLSEALAAKVLNLLYAWRLIDNPPKSTREAWSNGWFLPALEEARDRFQLSAQQRQRCYFQKRGDGHQLRRPQYGLVESHQGPNLSSPDSRLAYGYLPG